MKKQPFPWIISSEKACGKPTLKNCETQKKARQNHKPMQYRSATEETVNPFRSMANQRISCFRLDAIAVASGKRPDVCPPPAAAPAQPSYPCPASPERSEQAGSLEGRACPTGTNRSGATRSSSQRRSTSCRCGRSGTSRRPNTNPSTTPRHCRTCHRGRVRWASWT